MSVTHLQIRQLDRLRDRLNNDPHLTPEAKRKQLRDFASGFNPPPTEEIKKYLDSNFGTVEEEAEGTATGLMRTRDLLKRRQIRRRKRHI